MGANASTEFKGGRVLVVDDNEAIRESLTEVLRLAGYRTDSVTKGDEATPELSKGDVALVVLDVGLDFGGLTLLDALPEKPPVVLISAQPDRRRTPRGSVFLSKPFPPDRLLEEVQRLLGPRGKGKPEGHRDIQAPS
jgi:DNA-binding response OmpR family regulator